MRRGYSVLFILIIFLIFQIKTFAASCDCVPDRYRSYSDQSWVSAGQIVEIFGVYMKESMLQTPLISSIYDNALALGAKVDQDECLHPYGECSLPEMVGRLFKHYFSTIGEFCWDGVKRVAGKIKDTTVTCTSYVIRNLTPENWWPSWVKKKKASTGPKKTYREILRSKMNHFIDIFRSFESYSCFNQDGRVHFIAASLNTLYWKAVGGAMSMAMGEFTTNINPIKNVSVMTNAAKASSNGYKALFNKAKEIGMGVKNVYDFVNRRSLIVKSLEQKGYWKTGCTVSQLQF